MKRWGAGSLVLALAALWCLSGCGLSALEQDYGRSVANNVAQQVINPQAGLDTTPAVGLDPKAAVNLQERYDKSFKGEEKVSPLMRITTESK